MPYLTSVVGVPIDGTGTPAGCERAPSALREAGLIAAINLPDLGDLAVALNDPTRDTETGILGFNNVVATSESIRASVSELLHGGERPLLIGGDCTLLIGVAAALRDVYGRAGLAFIDGHIDHYDGKSTPTGEPADMELAVLSGTGPSALTGLAGESPLIFPADITAIGIRDLQEAREHGSPEPHPAIRIFEFDAAVSLDELSDLGKQTASRFAADPGRFWLHLDFDVLDTASMPAVDYRMPGGYDWKQLERVVKPFAQSPALLGMDITIYNPNLDPDGAAAAKIVEFLASIIL